MPNRAASVIHHLSKALPLLFLFTAALHGIAEDLKMELDIATVNQIEAKTLANGEYQLTTTGSDPFIFIKPVSFNYDPNKDYVFSFDYFCMEGLDSIQLFYGPPIIEQQSAAGPELLSSEGWTSYALNIKACQEPGSWRSGYKQFRIDLGSKAGRIIQLRNIRLRAPTADEQKAAMAAMSGGKSKVAVFDEALQGMVTADHDAHITSVKASDTSLSITIDAQKKSVNLLLCEVPFYQSPIGRNDFVWQEAVPELTGSRTIEVKRFRGPHDRVFSSWILMRKAEGGLMPASHQRFPDIIPAQWSLKQDRPLSKKGSTGLEEGNKFQIDDYKALGIHNTTKNIVLPQLVLAKAGENTFPHVFNGTTVHINSKHLDALDKSMIESDALKIVVSSIILIPKNTPMSHPDCAPQGIYAMANVVEEKGWNVYAAGLDFLAQRYTRPDRKYGRITHWILHNEVDSGWIWTNAGDKPLHTYLDLYYRSMRTAQSVIRRYGDAGDVLISLTHYWTTAHNSKCYKPKDMVDLLAKRCAQEGDFDWGLAYHPYPADLRNPRTWEDKNVTFDFETKKITPKNLEVLDAYMRQKSMLYDGKVRIIVLSEQGSNSRDYKEKSLQDQSAGLVYTWLKFRDMDSIESYIHHRWKDHPDEGGLLLGFRKIGDDTDPEATKKPAWEIWRKLGTPQEKEAFEFAKPIIGIKDVTEVRYNGIIGTGSRTDAAKSQGAAGK